MTQPSTPTSLETAAHGFAEAAVNQELAVEAAAQQCSQIILDQLVERRHLPEASTVARGMRVLQRQAPVAAEVSFKDLTSLYARRTREASLAGKTSDQERWFKLFKFSSKLDIAGRAAAYAIQKSD